MSPTATLLIAEPRAAMHGVGLAMVLGGPAVYLVGESLCRLRVTGAANAKRFAVAAVLVALVPVGGRLSALALSAIVAALLTAAALWELRGATRAEVSRTRAPVRSWGTSPRTRSC